MNKKILLLLILLSLATLNYLKTYRQNSPYKLDSFIYQHIFWQLNGNAYQQAKEKVFENKRVVTDETVREIVGNESVYKNLYDLFPKRPLYPAAAFIINFITGNPTLAFALPPFVAYLGFITVFYFICPPGSLFLAFYNPLVLSSASFMPDTIAAFFWLLNLVFILKYFKSGKKLWLFLFIIFDVLSLFVREQSLLMLPFSLILLFSFRFSYKNKLLLKRSLNIALFAAFVTIVYHILLYLFSQKTFVDTILYLQSGYGLREQQYSLAQTLQFYFVSLIKSHIVFLQVLITYPWRLLFFLLALLGVRIAISDSKNRLVNYVMFTSGAASYLAIFAYPAPNPRYFFALVASIIYFAVYFVASLRSKGNFKPIYMVIAVLLAGAVMIFSSLFKSDQIKLEKLLRGVDIAKFQSNKNQDQTAVLRLAAFYQWNKEDPLFTSPDFDTEAFKNSIDYLINEQDILLKFINKTDHVYPIDFLTAMAEAAKAQEIFMNRPTSENGKTLLEKQLEAAHLYKKEARDLIRPISEAKFYSPILYNITTNKDVAISDLKLIAENGDKLIKEIENRKSCLEGSDNCERPSLEFKTPKIKKFLDPNLPLLSKDFVYYDEEKVDIKGPYVANTLCFGYGKNLSYPTHYFYLKNLEEGFDYIKPIADIRLATDMYFEQITQDTNLYYKKKLWGKGIPYAVVDSTIPYKCPYLGYLSEVLALDEFLKKHKPILEKLESDTKFVEEVKKTEAEFFERKYPSYEEAIQLAQIYGYLYNSSQAPTDFKDELLERKLKIERRLLSFDGLLNYLTRFVRSTRMYEEVELKAGSDHAKEILYPEFAQNTVYPLRSYYSIMFLPFSSSVWRLDEKPQYAEKKIIKGLVGFDSVVVNYQLALEHYSPEEIKRWLIPRWDLLSDCAFKDICD
ncbi:MAG: hypothetical protein Q8P25_00805 [Candidatus Curtissbacteria bacterium]|nr:hypothetical protein [Candidatus Curtissbacteria bacterium]